MASEQCDVFSWSNNDWPAWKAWSSFFSLENKLVFFRQISDLLHKAQNHHLLLINMARLLRIFKVPLAVGLAILILVCYLLGANVLLLLFGGAALYGLLRFLIARKPKSSQVTSLMVTGLVAHIQSIVEPLGSFLRTGVQEVYLLTETASDYFLRFGFRPIDRSAIAPAIHASVEWTSVCPASVQAMVLQIETGEENVARPFGNRSVSSGRTEKRREEQTMVTTTEQAWEAFHAPLQQFIRRRVADEATVEDLLQEVFLKIHEHGRSLKDVKRLESWIYQITRNLIIDYYRSCHHRMTTLDDVEVLDLPEELPDDDMVSELLPSVRAMVLALPDQDRQALVLTEYQGLTQKELGERLGLSFSGAKSRVQRAREKLKQELLACCHFELDRRGHILDYQPRCDCCEQSACCDDASPETSQPARTFSPTSVSSSI